MHQRKDREGRAGPGHVAKSSKTIVILIFPRYVDMRTHLKELGLNV